MKHILQFIKNKLSLNIRGRSIFLMALVVFFAAIIAAYAVISINRMNDFTKYYDNIAKLQEKFLTLRAVEKEFLYNYRNDKDFAETANNQHLKRFNNAYNEIKYIIEKQRESEFTTDIEAKQIYLSLESNILDYNTYFERLYTKISEKGYGNYGIAANLSRSVSVINKMNKSRTIEEYFSQLRNYEYNYFIQNDIKPYNKFVQKANELKSLINTGTTESAEYYTPDSLKIFKTQTDSTDNVVNAESTIKEHINNYIDYFTKIVEIDKEIGYTQNEGINNQLYKSKSRIEIELEKLINAAKTKRTSINKTLINGIIALISIAVVVILIVLIIFTRITIRPIIRLTKYIEGLEHGILPDDKLVVKEHNELSGIINALNSLVDGLHKSTNFAIAIGKNDFDVEFKPMSNKDVLGNSLLDMRNSLEKARTEDEKRKIEDEKRNWSTSGISKFNDILRQSSNDLEELSYIVVSNLVQYLKANQGGVFIYNDLDESDLHLKLAASYAYNRRKYLERNVKVGEGIVGAVAIEKKTVHLKQIPEDYIEITSGLGKATPKTILIVPLLREDNVMGVLEIASFKEFQQHEIDFVEKVAENIAATISNVKINQQTKELLEESQRKSEAMAAQEEEMRQNLEELQSTREEASRKEAEASSFVNAVNHTTIRADFDLNGNLIYANSKFLDILGYTSTEVKDKHISYFIVDEYRSEIVERWEKLAKGGRHFSREIQYRTKNGTTWLLGTYTTVKDNEGNIIKILHLAYNIEEKKKQEFELKRRASELKKVELEIRSKVSELTKTKEQLEQRTSEQNNIQNKLKQKTYLLDALMQNVPDAIYFKDKDSKFILVSNADAKLFGFDNPDSMIGKSDFDFFTEDHAMPAFNDEQHIIRTGEPMINKIEKETYKDGRVKYVATSKMPLKDLDGNIVGTFGISRDITEMKTMEFELKEQNDQLKSVEEELRQNLDQMQDIQEDLKNKNQEYEKIHQELKKQTYLLDALMDNIPDAIYFKDSDSKYIRISRSQAKLFGFNDPDKVAAKSDFDFYDKGHAESTLNNELRIMRTGKAMINHIEREVWPDGSVTWVSMTKMPLYDSEGTVVGTFGISRDITEQKELEIELKEQNEALQTTEEELRQNLEEIHAIQDDLQRKSQKEKTIRDELENKTSLLKALMENVPDAVYFKDRESKFILVSDADAKLFGFDNPDDMVGKSDFDFFTDEHALPAFNDEQKIIKTGEPIINKVEKETYKDGSVKYVSTSKMPLRDLNEKIIGTFGISRDITEMKVMEIELREKNEELLATEEELRQNLEELKTIQEDLEQRNNDYSKIVTQLSHEKKIFDILMDNIDYEVMMKNPDGVINVLNMAQSEKFDVEKPEDAIGKTLIDFLPPKKAQKIMSHENLLMTTDKTMIDVEFRQEDEKGNDVWEIVTKIPIIVDSDFDDKELLGLFVLTKNITTLKNMEIEIDDYKHLLEAVAPKLKGMIYSTDTLGNFKNVQFINTDDKLFKFNTEKIINIDSVFPQVDELILKARKEFVVETDYSTEEGVVKLQHRGFKNTVDPNKYIVFAFIK